MATERREHVDREQDDVAAALRSAGLKATPQRVAVVRMLDGDRSHPTAQDVFDRLRVDHPTMSFATVYNTLSALSRIGWVTPLHVAGGPTRFDPRSDVHHHALCDACGALQDVSVSAPIERASGADADDHAELAGFEIRRVERIYRGICAGCQAGAPADDGGAEVGFDPGGAGEETRATGSVELRASKPSRAAAASSRPGAVEAAPPGPDEREP